MKNAIHVVMFDVDGVLIDSLPQHLQICRDKAAEYRLKIDVPTVDEFRRMVSLGKKVSPMRDFFFAVGFPEENLDRAELDYKAEFMKRYSPPVFNGAHEMLHRLHELGLRLGLVTANIKDNVAPALGKSMKLFDERCLFFQDRYVVPPSKSWCLNEGARLLDANALNCVYVGDQPADARAAFDAGWQFLGVTYGWGIVSGETKFETASSIDEIPDKILAIGG
jgi:phosphoglycolate phosphatase